MKKTLNKEELRLKIEARRKDLARQKRLEEAKARANGVRRVSQRPVVTERKVATRKPVVTETRISNRFKKQETLKENIMRRNKAANIPANLHKTYAMLAENIANYDKARKSITENFNASSQRTDANIGGVSTFFDIFFGFFPQLIAPHIASVQPMKTENGFIFYMEYVAGSDKGLVSQDDVLINPWGASDQYEYTSNEVKLGSIAADAAGAGLSLEKATWAPVVDVLANGVKVENSATVEGATLTITSGASTVKVELSKAPTKAVEFSYTYDNAFAPTEVPLLKPHVVRLPIAAKYRTIKTNHAFSAAYGAEAEHGIFLGEKLAEAAMEQLKREIDLEVLAKAFNAADFKVIWNKAAGVAVGGYQEHKLSLKDAIAQAANRIFKTSKRVRGNVLVVGVDVLTIIETLPGFNGVELGEQLPGAAVVGKLGKMPVIASADVPADEFLVLYKGSKDNFDAGLVFAPYLPVFATEPAILDDFVIRQAFITAYALKVVNPKYFVGGRIINDPVALPIYLITKDGAALEDEQAEIGVDAVLDIFG